MRVRVAVSVSHVLTVWSWPPVISFREVGSKIKDAQPPWWAVIRCVHVFGTVDSR